MVKPPCICCDLTMKIGKKIYKRCRNFWAHCKARCRHESRATPSLHWLGGQRFRRLGQASRSCVHAQLIFDWIRPILITNIHRTHSFLFSASVHKQLKHTDEMKGNRKRVSTQPGSDCTTSVLGRTPVTDPMENSNECYDCLLSTFKNISHLA